jgi:transposase
MAATHDTHSTTTAVPTLYLAFELGWSTWNLAFTTGMAQKPRLRPMTARSLEVLRAEIRAAKQRFGLPEDVPVVSCYEAGRDGFWLHRYLVAQGIANVVVDAASIEVNRRFRRAKSDGLDVAKLLTMLIRWHGGERTLWSVVNVPTVADEDRRQLHRELLALKRQRTEHSNRIKGLLAGYGLSVIVDEEFPERLEGLRQWDGTPVPEELHRRLLREFERWKLADRQARDLDNERARKIRSTETFAVEKVRKLLDLGGIGENSAWLFVMEFFAWRQIKNRRELGSLAGLTPTPYHSGDSEREQGISKAGNARLRTMAIEIAWGWLRYQPESELSRWYRRRFGEGNTRLRKVGIVALARKLLVALWKYLEHDELPAGAVVSAWEKKLNGRLPAEKQVG